MRMSSTFAAASLLLFSTLADAEVTTISLNDYPMPLHDPFTPAEVQTEDVDGLEVSHGEGGLMGLSGPEKSLARSHALKSLDAARFPRISFQADDIVQEAMLRAFRAFDPARRPTHPRGSRPRRTPTRGRRRRSSPHACRRCLAAARGGLRVFPGRPPSSH